VYLQPADAKTQPSGWSQHADFTLTLVSQRKEMYNIKMGSTPRTFKAGAAG
jgi:hypothetical protein